jgi:methylenetetrahydrofolate dehydrogenase (NADP+)/methenyltetrahydrofolate cyclohydrolase
MKLSGIPIALKIKNELKARNVPTGRLAIIQVGDDPVSSLYVRKKLEFASELNIQAESVRLEADKVESGVSALANDSRVRGIIVQLPLPEGVEREQIISLIPKEKDVDGFHYILENQYITYPPTVLAINEILSSYHVPLEDGVLIVGGGFLVGKPLSKYLASKGIQVEILEKDSSDYRSKLKNAQVVIVATGGGRTFTDNDFKTGAYVIDASTVAEEKKIRGDVVSEGNTIHLSGVPGGVGPVTVAKLFENFFNL